MTGRDLVSASLRLIGAIAPGESIAASEATDGLATLNRMLDSFSNEGLTIYAITQESALTLTGGDSTYTLGASGDITTRPMSIERALIRDGNTDYPVKILSLDEFARISNKSTQSTHPDSLYDDGGYPQRTITLYPVPSASKQLILFTKRALTNISTLDTTISFPPGYEEMIVYNGAVRLAPEYDRPVSPEILQIAIESKANVKRANQRIHLMRSDNALIRPSVFNIETGGYR